MSDVDDFSVRYAVPMTCGSCVRDVKAALGPISGISDLNIDLDNKEITVVGTVFPSSILKALEGVGLDSIVRGSGLPNSAAVAILHDHDGQVQGLARLIQAGKLTLFDISVAEHLQSKKLFPSVNTLGDISGGAMSTGAALHSLAPFQGTNSHDKLPVSVMSLIGRSLVINTDSEKPSQQSLVGVIARSAGLWENNKEVCSCSGQTLWQENASLLVSSQGQL